MPEISLPRLDHNGRVPLYLQLKEWLKAGIRSGAWEVGTTVPSERALSVRLGISRATCRQAVEELVHEGWLVKRQGLGTFVARPKLEQPLSGLKGFSEAMSELGVEASTLLLGAKLIPAEADVYGALGLAAGDAVVQVTRVRLADGVPLMVEVSHLHYARVVGILDHDLTGSLYEVLRREYRITLALGHETLEVRPAEPWVLEALGLPQSLEQQIFYTERSARDRHGPVEFTRRYARADLCSFRVEFAVGSAEFTPREQTRSQEETLPPRA